MKKLESKEKLAILFLIVFFLIILVNFSFSNRLFSKFTLLIILLLVVIGSIYRAQVHKVWK